MTARDRSLRVKNHPESVICLEKGDYETTVNAEPGCHPILLIGNALFAFSKAISHSAKRHCLSTKRFRIQQNDIVYQQNDSAFSKTALSINKTIPHSAKRHCLSTKRFRIQQNDIVYQQNDSAFSKTDVPTGQIAPVIERTTPLSANPR
jgi:histone H3/H4